MFACSLRNTRSVWFSLFCSLSKSKGNYMPAKDELLRMWRNHEFKQLPGLE